MCDSPAPRSRGFTLVELLVVIAIVGILVALLLPAVQAAREAARRISCMNNLKQVATALHNYHDALRSFPPASVSQPRRHTWVPFLLPFIEHQNLHDAYAWNADWDHASNQPAITTRVAFLQCASTPAAKRIDTVRSGIEAAPGDYAPVTGFSQNLTQVGLVPLTSNRDGVLRGNESRRFADIVDGTSNTLVIAEDAGRPDFWIHSGHGPDTNSLSCGNLSVSGGRVRGAGWADTSSSIPLHGFTRDGLNCPGPCPLNCTNNNEAFSFHPGGVQAAFADGGVRFISESVDIATYAALITRAGSEVVNANAF